MKVKSARVVPFSGPLPETVGNARSAWSSRQGLLLLLTDQEGLVGRGEASPLPGYSPDSFAQVKDALMHLRWEVLPPLHADQPVLLQLRQALALLEVNAPSARFAIETALLDLLGQHAGLPISALLFGPAAHAALPLCALLAGQGRDEVLSCAQKAMDRGIRTLKCKVGRPGAFASELSLLHALRDHVGPKIRIRLDANGMLEPDRVLQRLHELSAIAPEFIEEPVPIAFLPRDHPLPVPIALDESLQGPDAEEVILRGGHDVLVLKPMALGGFLRCLDLVRCGTRGAKVVVTHLLDGPVALAAVAELALSLPEANLACGLDAHPGLRAWPPMSVTQITENAVVQGSYGGLGIRGGT